MQKSLLFPCKHLFVFLGFVSLNAYTQPVVTSISPASGPLNAASFAGKVDFVTASPGTSPLALGDLDGDGLAEMVTTAGGALASVFKINTTSRLPPVITSFTPASGSAGSSVTITGTNFNSTPAANTVYFGAVKAVVTGGSATNLTVTVPAGATYQPVSVLNTANGLAGYSSKPFIITFTNPAGTGIPASFYLPRTDFATGNLPYAVAMGDLDGDGKTDMVAINANDNTVSVLRNTAATLGGAPSFASRVDFATGTDPRAVLISDMDGDGKLDIIVLNSVSGTISVLRNTSVMGSITAASFAAKADLEAGLLTYPYAVAVGDLNGDGRPDLAVPNLLTGSLGILRNTSNTGSITGIAFAAKTDFTTGIYPRYIAVSDLDGDGMPDLAVANERSNTVSVLRNTTAAGSSIFTFDAKVDFPIGTNPPCVAAGDIDGDGRPDLVVANYASNTLSVLRNTAVPGSITAASFAAKVDFATGTNPFCVAMGDADGDGRIDLAVANANSNTVSVLRSTSTTGNVTPSAFAGRVDFATSTYPMFIAMGDLNGDGIPEIASANGSAKTISVLRVNTGMSVSAATASATEQGMHMQLYPNPTQGELVLQLAGIKAPVVSLEVLNAGGTVVEKRTVSTGGAAWFTLRLSLRNQPEGIYYVKLTGTGGVRIEKVVVQR